MDLAGFLSQQQAARLYRQRRTLTSAQASEVAVAGRHYLNFCSNDYLGLANHPRVKAAFIRAAETYGVGSGASQLITGHQTPHHELEQELADFFGRPRALLFSTGYMANLGTVSALMQRGDGVFEDRLNHASLIDAGLACDAGFKRYAHCDVTALAQQLEQSPAREKLVITDGLFSMDGDLAPLPELAELCRQYNAWLMVDDAHGIGVLGQHGRGSLEQLAVDPADVPVLVGTMGKAFGTFGAFVTGSEELIETLIQKARTYIYTTAMPAAVAEASRASLQLIRDGDALRASLLARIHQFREGARHLGLPVLASASPIQPLLVGDSERAMTISEQLQARGLLISAIRPPTVPAGTARLRITLSAAHTEQQVGQLLAALETVRSEFQQERD
jgi:8-amino-7-oxononanoate synthase